jgi:SM-20-related protein
MSTGNLTARWIERRVSLEVARSIVLDEFLVRDELIALMEYVNGRREEFRASQVVGRSGPGEQDYRRSLVLMDSGPFHNLFSERIQFYFPRIVRALNHPYFEISRVESQITASNDGDYFRIHNDNTHADAPSRTITYVYFFHREPRPFRGGELILYDSPRHGDSVVPAAIRRRVTPEQNTIIFFPSSALHEILPVICESRDFRDSRFTLNGWLHR